MTLDEINQQIAKLMQEKAEDQALAHYVAPRASYRFDYIINGDRSGLDKFDASEQAYATMLAKQRMANDEAYRQRVFNELSKEADRLNTLKIARQNKSQQSDYNLSKARETLGNLAITRDTLAGQGKDTRMVDNQIQSLVERYPELQMPITTDYDPTKSVDYKLAKFTPINSKSTNSEDIADAIDELKKFNTPESAKRLAELELEYDKRIKYEQSEAYVKDLIKAFDVNTGDLDPALANLGYESLHGVGGKFKLVKDGKVVKSYKAKKSQSWD
jgi:hypothetical protein